MTTQSALFCRTLPTVLKPACYSSNLFLNEFPLHEEGRRVLDVGCAAGYLSEILAGRGFRVVSIDRPGTLHSADVEFAGADLAVRG
jgi:2-polyprenyl-3-methyl-5-hydroxy-6-metoxy-1,4-benzoquinol methylase